MVTSYNLPPRLCMKNPYIFLLLIIPSLKNSRQSIDSYLQPLIDKLKELWKNGVETYDEVKPPNASYFIVDN